MRRYYSRNGGGLQANAERQERRVHLRPFGSLPVGRKPAPRWGLEPKNLKYTRSGRCADLGLVGRCFGLMHLLGISAVLSYNRGIDRRSTEDYCPGKNRTR
jgi:hypothetical protein